MDKNPQFCLCSQMDPHHALHDHQQYLQPHMQQHQQTMPSMHSPSLVCVGGMLRVAAIPDLAINTPAPSPTSPYIETTTHANVTPFKQLASPFTASAPFTAPTTPYSTASTLTIPTTPYSTTIQTAPYSIATTHSAPPNSFYSLLSPAATTPNPAATPAHNTSTVTYDLQPQPQTQLLTQKQVRELRRLCRKTANRAEFEDRLIQIRQVASIAAMATSTIHLFDPDNPASGYALRAWVENHRAAGADWRDERPLSSEAIIELRRWDRQLKNWARNRFENQTASDTRCNSRPMRADAGDNVLKPVRLEFEKMSVGASPSPTTPANLEKPRNVYSTDFLRMGSPVTPADGGIHHLANSPAVAMHTQNFGIPVGTAASTAVLEDGQRRSAWSKPPLTGLTRWVDNRKPMTEVSINRVGDTIKVTVPPSTQSGVLKPSLDNNARFVAVHDQENAIPADIRRGSAIHASTTAKSWRNALMQTPEPVQDERVQVFRTAAKDLFSVPDGNVMGAESGMAQRSPMDWGKLRRGEADRSAAPSVWQTRFDNV